MRLALSQNKPANNVFLSKMRPMRRHSVAAAFGRQGLWSFQWIKKQTATWQCGDVPLFSLPQNWSGFVFACCPFATTSRVQTAALIDAKMLFVWMWWMDVSHLSPFCILICGGKKPNPARRAHIKRAQMSKQTLSRCVAQPSCSDNNAPALSAWHSLHDSVHHVPVWLWVFCFFFTPSCLARLLHAGTTMTVGAVLTDWIGGV